jgi:hypothetical protein
LTAEGSLAIVRPNGNITVFKAVFKNNAFRHLCVSTSRPAR